MVQKSGNQWLASSTVLPTNDPFHRGDLNDIVLDEARALGSTEDFCQNDAELWNFVETKVLLPGSSRGKWRYTVDGTPLFTVGYVDRALYLGDEARV